jgi:hypothetical protein
MHRYNNSSKYGFTAVKSEFKCSEPDEPVYEEEPVAIQQKPTRKYLPGERLLKKLSQQEEKKKPLDMKIIEKSISEILDKF